MPPARKVDFEVRTLAGALVFTSPEQDLAVAWADRHCAPRWALVVERAERFVSRKRVHLAQRRLDAAS